MGIIVKFGLLLCFFGCISINTSFAKSVQISEKTRYYTVSGKTLQTVLKSMTRRGPWFNELNVRAIALADYKYRTNVKTKMSKGLCRVTDASVTMQIFYILPKLSRSAPLNKRDKRKWGQISSLLTRHEHIHGRNYKRLAADLQRSLRKMKPQKNCRNFKKLERQIRKKQERADKLRNQRFDKSHYKYIYSRLDQLAPKWRKRKRRR